MWRPQSGNWYVKAALFVNITSEPLCSNCIVDSNSLYDVFKVFEKSVPEYYLKLHSAIRARTSSAVKFWFGSASTWARASSKAARTSESSSSQRFAHSEVVSRVTNADYDFIASFRSSSAVSCSSWLSISTKLISVYPYANPSRIAKL